MLTTKKQVYKWMLEQDMINISRALSISTVWEIIRYAEAILPQVAKLYLTAYEEAVGHTGTLDELMSGEEKGKLDVGLWLKRPKFRVDTGLITPWDPFSENSLIQVRRSIKQDLVVSKEQSSWLEAYEERLRDIPHDPITAVTVVSRKKRNRTKQVYLVRLKNKEGK